MTTLEQEEAILQSMNHVPRTVEAYEEALSRLAKLHREFPFDRRIDEVQHSLTMDLTGLEWLERRRAGLE